MALLNDHLSIWEVSFRWAGHDPDKLWPRIPLAVRDNFRNLISEIHSDHLECFTLGMEKYTGDDPDEEKFYIRYWLAQIEECSAGNQYNRKLLKWANVERDAFQLWCERHKVPLPEFWFPPNWGLDYEWPDNVPEEVKAQEPGESIEDRKVRLDKRHRFKMAYQQIALSMWESNPDLLIKEIAMGDEIQKFAGGSKYVFETIRDWIGEVDPRDPAKKRGVKRKNNSGSGNSDKSQLSEK